MRDQNGNKFYADDKNNELIKIPFKEEIKRIGDRQVLYRSKNHIGMLTLLMNDAPSLHPKIQAIEKLS